MSFLTEKVLKKYLVLLKHTKKLFFNFVEFEIEMSKYNSLYRNKMLIILFVKEKIKNLKILKTSEIDKS